MNAPKVEKNNPAKKGQPASSAVIHGQFRQYSTFAMHTRFDRVQWFTTDVEQKDQNNPELPRVIRQCDTFDDAVNGLNPSPCDALAEQAQNLKMGY
jgi:hypothetical protein